MFTEFYGFKENPFGLLADFSFFCIDAPKKETCDRILQDLQDGFNLLVVTGVLGVGKTQFLRYLNTLLPSNTQSITLSGGNVSYADRIRFIVERITENNHSGKKSLVIVDDAHEIPDDDLRLLLSLASKNNQEVPHFQIILCGLLPLKTKLDRIDFKQFIDKYRCHYHLAGLNELQVRDYINFRLKRVGYDKDSEEAIFSTNVIKLITALSHGLPHSINLICGASLLMASLDEQRIVSEQHVREASLSCLLSIESAEEQAKSVHLATFSKKPLAGLRNKGLRDLINKPRHLKPLTLRLAHSKRLLRQVTRAPNRLPGASPTKLKASATTPVLYKKFGVAVLFAIGIGLVGLFIFKMFYSQKSDPSKVETLKLSQQTRITEKKVISPPIYTVDNQKSITLIDLNKQLLLPINKTANEAMKLHDQRIQFPDENLTYAETKNRSKKIEDKEIKEDLKLAKREAIQGKDVSIMKPKKITLASPAIHQENPKQFAKPIKGMSKTQNQEPNDTSLDSIPKNEINHSDSAIDAQEASVRERSVNRLKLDKLGMAFNIESLLKVCRQGDVQALKLLLAGGIPPDIKDVNQGISPLLEGAKNGQLQVVQILLEKGAYADIKNYEGQTPLMIAAKNGDKRIVKALIDGGAHPYIQDLKGLTARSYAEQTHNSEIINLLANN